MLRLSSLIAACVMMLSMPGNAATVTIVNNGSYDIVVGDLYSYDQTLMGNGGSQFVSFEFTADAADAPLSAFAATVNFSILGTLTGAYLEWIAPSGATTVSLGNIGNGVFSNSGSVSTLFSAATGLVQTLKLGWSSRSGTLLLNVQAEATAAPVPLPASGPLLVAVIGGLAALTRRRRMAA